MKPVIVWVESRGWTWGREYPQRYAGHFPTAGKALVDAELAGYTVVDVLKDVHACEKCGDSRQVATVTGL